FGIAGFKIPGDIEVVAAHPDDDVVPDRDRSDRPVVHLVEIADGLVPALGAILRIERNQVAIGRFEIEMVAVHGGAAIADMHAADGVPGVVPELAAGARVNGPGVVGEGEVEDAIYHQRGRLDRASAELPGVRAIYPGKAERLDIGRVDFGERTES